MIEYGNNIILIIVTYPPTYLVGFPHLLRLLQSLLHDDISLVGMMILCLIGLDLGLPGPLSVGR